MMHAIQEWLAAVVVVAMLLSVVQVLIPEGPTAAYISDKANTLGLVVTAKVRAESGDGGVPVPWSAELVGPRSEALAVYIEDELGIPRGRQTWNEVEN